MQKIKKLKIEVKRLIKENENLQGLYFTKRDQKAAGRKANEADAVAYLSGKGSEYNYNLQPPAKCLIKAYSRPFEEWDIVRASKTIQERVYSLPNDKIIDVNIGTSKKDIEKWLADFDINIGDYWSVKGLNLIIKNAIKTYEGVKKKVDNRNAKNKNKIESKNIWRKENNIEPLEYKEELSINPDGTLINPPGINRCIFSYQDIKIQAVKALEMENIPEQYREYNRDIDKLIESLSSNKKISSSYKKHRRRKWYSNSNNRRKDGSSKYTKEQKLIASAKDDLLCQMSFGNDWLLFDARGLLRNLKWRGLAPEEGLTIQDMLKYFTGDPVINYETKEITLLYKEGVVPVFSQKPISYKKAPEIIKKLLCDKTVAMISIDLGQTNPVAAKISTISQDSNGELISVCNKEMFLSDDLLEKLKGYRERTDKFNEALEKEALSLLTPEHQKEFEIRNNDKPKIVLERISKELGIDISINYNDMCRNTKYIADAKIASGGDCSSVMRNFNGKEVKGNDGYFSKKFRAQISEEASKALREKKQELQRNSDVYEKLSKSKKEWSRSCVNWIIKEAKNITGCEEIIINIEALVKKGGFFDGAGKIDKDFDNIFNHKKENRWVINSLHQSFLDTATNRGMIVIKSDPHRTSITCTVCRHCNKENRNGEIFKCKNCAFEANTDLTIAPTNLQGVALTGKAMPKPANEQPSVEKKPRTARKGKKITISRSY